ncbi:hypothetical protein CPB85DRAFT_1443961 [Mucidula mucida]|nr:hypothetical protein CPB85DRAFT_1443961 [Mucidula mucida]
MFRVGPIFKIASNHTGLFGCLTRVWVRVVTEQQPLPVVDHYMRLIVDRCLPRTPAEKEFGGALEQLPTGVIPIITISTLQRLIKDLHSTPIKVESVRLHLCVLVQGSMNSAQMLNACFASHVGKWCCVVMKRLMSRKHVLPAGCEEMIVGTVHVSFILLSVLSQAGWSVMVEPMEHGFLECVFRCQPLFDYQQRTSSESGRLVSAVLTDLLNLYNACALHRPVLRASYKAIKKVMRRSLEDDIKQEGPVWEAWERLKVTVNERWQAKEDYIEAGPKDWCDNVSCQMFASPEFRLQQCGCATAYYCSRTCQRVDWKSGHKEWCNSRQQIVKDGKAIPTTRRDIQFFFAMAEGDYRRHSDPINKLINDFLGAHGTSTVLPSPIVIQFDYVSVPRKVTITTADKIPKDGDWDALVEKGRRNLGQLVHLIVEDNAGQDGKSLQVFGIIDSSSRLRA